MFCLKYLLSEKKFTGPLHLILPTFLFWITAFFNTLVIRSSLKDWQSMKKECIHARHNTVRKVDGKLRNVYITSQYWDIMYKLQPNTSLQMPKTESSGNRTRAARVAGGHSTSRAIYTVRKVDEKLPNVYITSQYWDIMYKLRSNSSLQIPKIELHRPGIEPGPPVWQHIKFYWQ